MGCKVLKWREPAQRLVSQFCEYHDGFIFFRIPAMAPALEQNTQKRRRGSLTEQPQHDP